METTNIVDFARRDGMTNPQFRTKKMIVFEKISKFVEKFKGVGGQI